MCDFEVLFCWRGFEVVLLEREINRSKQDAVLTALQFLPLVCQCFMRPLHQVTVGALCDHCIRSLSVLYVTTILGGRGTRKKQRNQNQQQNILVAWSSKREWENKNKYNGGQAFVCVCVWFLPVSNDIMLILSPANFLMLYCCTLLNLWQDCGQRGVCCDTKVLCDTRVLCLR